MAQDLNLITECKNYPYYTVTEIVTRGVHYLISKISAEEKKSLWLI